MPWKIKTNIHSPDFNDSLHRPGHVGTDVAQLDRQCPPLYRKRTYLGAARPRGQYIEIQILDNGAGIPEDQLEEIFFEFHQLQNSARDRRQGLGLGLAIVKRLANLLHHDIKVTSRLGRGSCFSITLPSAHATAEPDPRQLIEKASLSNDALLGCQVMALDDDISVLAGMQGLLSRWGCHVIIAGTPAEAMEKLAANVHRLEILIVDYRLPDNVSGIDVARSLQKPIGVPSCGINHYRRHRAGSAKGGRH